MSPEPLRLANRGSTIFKHTEGDLNLPPLQPVRLTAQGYHFKRIRLRPQLSTRYREDRLASGLLPFHAMNSEIPLGIPEGKFLPSGFSFPET